MALSILMKRLSSINVKTHVEIMLRIILLNVVMQSVILLVVVMLITILLMVVMLRHSDLCSNAEYHC